MKRLGRIARDRGMRTIGPDSYVERLALCHAPNVAGVRALSVHGATALTLITAPGIAFRDPDLRGELKALTEAARSNDRRAILVPKRSIMLRAPAGDPGLRPRRRRKRRGGRAAASSRSPRP
ncbi:hypothetical protein [Methylopila turkensis]|nr:hypothetical protein [Methylopila turkensis]